MEATNPLTALLLVLLAIAPSGYAVESAPAAQATKSAGELRSRTLIDADWRFKLEPQIVVPAGPKTELITDWTVHESTTGEDG